MNAQWNRLDSVIELEFERENKVIDAYVNRHLKRDGYRPSLVRSHI